MNCRRSLLLVTLALLACAPVRSQEPEPTPAKDERLERILEKVGEGVEKYQAELFRIAFTETLTQEELREDMTPKKSKEHVFDTIVAREALSEDEDDYYPKIVRRIRTIDGKPAKRAKRLDAAAFTSVSSLVFLLPQHRKDFQFTLEGEEQFEGRRAYRIRMLRPGEGPPRVEWKKRLVGYSFIVFAPTMNFFWVDAESFDVLRIESHLEAPFEFEGPRVISTGPFGRLGPKNKFRYARYDYAASFRRVQLKDREETRLVPDTVEVVAVIEGAGHPRTRRATRFDDYKRFRSDVKVVEEP